MFSFFSSTRKFGIWLIHQWSQRSLARMQNSSTKEKKGQFTLGEPRHSGRRASKAATGIVCKSKWSNTCTDEVGIINAGDLVPQKICAHLKTSPSLSIAVTSMMLLTLACLNWGESTNKIVLVVTSVIWHTALGMQTNFIN